MIITYFLNLKHETKSCCCAAFISAQQQLIFMEFAQTVNLFLRPHQHVIRPVLNSYVKIFYVLFLSGVCAYRRNIRIIASYTFVYG